MDKNKCQKSNNGEHHWFEHTMLGRVCKNCGQVEPANEPKLQMPIPSPYMQEFQEQMQYEKEDNLTIEELTALVRRTNAKGVIVVSFKNPANIFNSPVKMSSLGIDKDQLVKVIEVLGNIKKQYE